MTPAKARDVDAPLTPREREDMEQFHRVVEFYRTQAWRDAPAVGGQS